MNNKKKIIFYTHSARAFRATLIGYLYELSQTYEIILISEPLDNETQKLLSDKSLFPYLDCILPVDYLVFNISSLIKKNRRMSGFAKHIIETYRPWIVIMASDMHSLFEMYLARHAKENHAKVICIQPTTVGANITFSKWVDLLNAYKFQKHYGIPYSLAKPIVTIRKKLGHAFVYWLLPVLAGEKPLFGKSSYILRQGNSGMRDADLQIVPDNHNKSEYIKDGVPLEKLIIFPHPALRQARHLFLDQIIKKNYEKRTALILLPGGNDVGFTQKSYNLISEKQYKTTRLDIVSKICTLLEQWNVILKPHPIYSDDTKLIVDVQKKFPRITIVSPLDPIEAYLPYSDAVFDLPRPASSVLEMCALIGIPAFALDIHQEFTGDTFSNTKGIQYVNSLKALDSLLEKLKNNTFPYAEKPAYSTLSFTKLLTSL